VPAQHDESIPAARPPVQFALDPDKPRMESAQPEKNKVSIRIPLLVSGTAQSSAGKIDGTMVEIEAPGGMGWNSGWFRSSDVLLTERPSTNVFFDVDECHRGSARYNSSWREILEYFEPAFQLGMTATPLRQENRDTYARGIKFTTKPSFIPSTDLTMGAIRLPSDSQLCVYQSV
jgi:hypothetical protein